MCGIVGWVDFGRDLTGERATLRAMTDTLTNRGVDDSGVWIRGHAALGHTRTAIIDVAGGAQPLTVEQDGREVATIVYNGEVYNFKQLRTELRARGHEFRTRSDTEVVLRAYLEWGVECAARLEGIFAFAIWDLRRQELVLVRDRLGVKPLFYARRPEGLLFGSEPKALLANPLVRPLVGLDNLQELFATAKRPGMSVFRDLRAVLPGTTLTISRAGMAQRRYWALEARPHTDDLDGTVGHVRELLHDIVLRELESEVPLCTALSGGMDSSAVSAIAAYWRWKLDGERIRTFVTTFDDYAARFQPDDVRFTPDEVYADEVARHLEADHVRIQLSTRDLMDRAARDAVLWAQDMPTTLGDMDTSNYLTARRIKEHSTVALSGEVADEIFGGYSWMYDQQLLAADMFPWVAKEYLQPGSPRGQGRGLFDPGFMAKLDLGTYYRDQYRTALAAAPYTGEEDDTERLMRGITHVTLTWWLPMLLDRDDRLAMANALELRVPYGDHRLVEYLYNTPWRLKTFDGREKSLLRAAARDLVPHSVLDRAKSPWPVTQDPAYAEMLRDELSALVNDPSAPSLPLLDLAAVRATLDRPSEIAHQWVSRMNIEMVLQFDAWLRRYDVQLAI
ncbi:asparagine synthase (glutamine-hydrolyzing) [Micromonospora sp. WMMD558]|uniref:asparagine synthase (glutamine-hydrolyzing) n=1 Tax=unclassified Micromonospora TaxID=2617518 RepID=UPI0012B4D91C|nr:asparagine synthase (glutamine-hydrolyzing) [Micromonospora sp. WMMC415]QGN49933.1 asparagine synthase (glutamine-hydrolyzing) [Micromonospora sp. WMMC415]